MLICTHNKARLLDRALESVAGQELPSKFRWEVLVVGNRCTDETPEVVRRWGESGRIPRLRYLSERRPGVSLTHDPPSTERRRMRWDRAEVAAFAAAARDVPPAER